MWNMFAINGKKRKKEVPMFRVNVDLKIQSTFFRHFWNISMTTSSLSKPFKVREKSSLLEQRFTISCCYLVIINYKQLNT